MIHQKASLRLSLAIPFITILNKSRRVRSACIAKTTKTKFFTLKSSNLSKPYHKIKMFYRAIIAAIKSRSQKIKILIFLILNKFMDTKRVKPSTDVKDALPRLEKTLLFVWIVLKIIILKNN